MYPGYPCRDRAAETAFQGWFRAAAPEIAAIRNETAIHNHWHEWAFHTVPRINGRFLSKINGLQAGLNKPSLYKPKKGSLVFRVQNSPPK